MKCYILIGPPGCGKSTYIEQHGLDKTCCILSFDAILERYAEQSGITYNQAFNLYAKTAQQVYNQEFAAALKEGKDIVVDKTNMSVKSRHATLCKLPEGCERIAVDLSGLDKATIMDRLRAREAKTGKHISEQVLNDMLARYEAPTTAEGFDLIIPSDKRG